MPTDSSKPKSPPLSGGKPSLPSAKAHVHPEQQAPSFAIRSPLFVKGNAKPEVLSQKPVSTFPPGEAPAPTFQAPGAESGGGLDRSAIQRPVSAIRGLADPLLVSQDATAFTSMQHVMYDASDRSLGRKSWLAALFLFLGLFCGALWSSPPLRRQVLHTLRNAQAKVTATMRSSSGARAIPPPSFDASEEPGADPRAIPPVQTTSRAPLDPPPKRTCHYLIQASLAEVQMSLAEKIDTVECHLLRGDTAEALRILDPIRPVLKKTSEVALNKVPQDRTLADAYHLLVVALLATKQVQQANDFTRDRCRVWASTNTCVTKLTLFAAQHYAVSASATQLFKTEGELSDKAQSRLWLAGALLAAQGPLAANADKRFERALKSAPQQARFLRREIYESYGFYLYRRGYQTKLNSIAHFGLSNLRKLDANSLLKLRFLSQLSTPGDTTRFIRSSLSRNDLRLAARKDARILTTLGTEAIRKGLNQDFLKLLAAIKAQEITTSSLTAPEARAWSEWEIRAVLAAGDSALALTKLSELESTHVLNATERHLRGVAYGMTSPAPRYQIWAAENFRQANHLQKNWESATALGFALLRGGQRDQVPEIIQFLEKAGGGEGKRYWLEMLKAEWYLAQGKILNAQTVSEFWLKKDPAYQAPRKLLVDVYTKLGKTTAAQAQRDDLEKRTKIAPWKGRQEALSSPLGPMSRLNPN